MGEAAYDISQGGVVVRGTLEAPQGGTLPEDITLVASTTDGFSVLIQPLVTGTIYELVVNGTAALTAAAGDVSTGGPQLIFDEPLSTAPGPGPVAITGKIILPPGVTLPSDLTLTAQSAVAAWAIFGTPAMTGPDTFSVVVSAPAAPGMTFIVAWSPTHPGLRDPDHAGEELLGERADTRTRAPAGHRGRPRRSSRVAR